MYVTEICAERIFVTFPGNYKKCKQKVKNTFFQMSAILKLDLKKKQTNKPKQNDTIRFPEVNYLNYTKKDPILQVTTTLPLKQGETRTSSGPIPHPLNLRTCFDHASIDVTANLKSDTLLRLRGYCTSYQKLACFLLYLQTNNTFLKNNICIL